MALSITRGGEMRLLLLSSSSSAGRLLHRLCSQPPASHHALPYSLTASHHSISSSNSHLAIRSFHCRSHRPQRLFLPLLQRRAALPSSPSSSLPLLFVLRGGSCRLHVRSFATASADGPKTERKDQQPQQPQQQQQQQSQSQQDKDSKQKQQSTAEDDPYTQADEQSQANRRPSGVQLFVGGLLMLLSFAAGFQLSTRGGDLQAASRPEGRSYLQAVTDVWSGLVDMVQYTVGQSERPLLPPPQLDAFSRKPRTLVLGLEDTLIHLDWDRFSSHVTKERPELRDFISAAFRQGWELVVFSSKAQYEVEPALTAVDKDGMLRHRLYYEQMNMQNGWRLIKDCSRLGRERRRVVIIDWNDGMWAGWEDNVLHVDRWRDGAEGEQDRQLRQTLRILDRIVRYNVQDVREVIRRRREGQENIFEQEEQLMLRASRGLQEKKKKAGLLRQRDAAAPASITADTDAQQQQTPAAAPAGAGWFNSLLSVFRKAATKGPAAGGGSAGGLKPATVGNGSADD